MQPRWFRPALVALALSSSALLGGCATHSQAGGATSATDDTNNDPYESFNRPMWEVDLTFDRYLLKPVAIGYRDATPGFFQTAVNNILTNMRGPVILVNDLLQGQTDNAGKTLARLYINTIFGLGGILDVATYSKVPFHDADFGQTLGVWGVDSGPYLVLPLLGPSDPRDAIGYGIDSFIDPFDIEMRAHGIDEANYVRMGVGVVNDRALTVTSSTSCRKARSISTRRCAASTSRSARRRRFVTWRRDARAERPV